MAVEGFETLAVALGAHWSRLKTCVHCKDVWAGKYLP